MATKNALFVLYSIIILPTSAVLLPLLPGPSNVTVHTGELIDYSRQDPLAPSPQPRAPMISIFQPANCSMTTTIPYMPEPMADYETANITGSSGLNLTASFAQFELPVCPDDDTCDKPQQDLPLVLFSPGMASSRLVYNHVASAVASFGYVVVTVDHPYEADFVEYPDGHVINSTYPFVWNDTKALYKETELRAQDLVFVLNQLGNATAVAGLIPSRGSRAFDTSKALVFGHSQGGATAMQCLAQEPRFIAGVNVDGPVYGAAVTPGINQPFFILQSTQPPPLAQDNWTATLTNAKAFKHLLRVEGSLHNDFGDSPTWLEILGYDTTKPPFSSMLESFELGPISAQRVVSVLCSYLVAFFEYAWAGEESVPELLQGPSEDFPEVTWVV